MGFRRMTASYPDNSINRARRPGTFQLPLWCVVATAKPIDIGRLTDCPRGGRQQADEFRSGATRWDLYANAVLDDQTVVHVYPLKDVAIGLKRRRRDHRVVDRETMPLAIAKLRSCTSVVTGSTRINACTVAREACVSCQESPIFRCAKYGRAVRRSSAQSSPDRQQCLCMAPEIRRRFSAINRPLRH